MNAISVKTCDFHGDRLATFEHDDTYWVAMRPIVEGMSLSWQVQQRKLQSQKRKFNCHHMVTVAEDGKNRSMLSIPLGKLSLWLASINPNKIRDAAVRHRVELYQAESAMALHDYWFKGAAIRPDAEASINSDMLAAIGAIVRDVVTEIVPGLVRSELAAYQADHRADSIDLKRREFLTRERKQVCNQIAFRESRISEDEGILEDRRERLAEIDAELRTGITAPMGRVFGPPTPPSGKRDVNDLAAFLRDTISRTNDPADRAMPEALWQAYQDWARRQGTGTWLPEALFYKALPGVAAVLGIRRIKSDGRYRYAGCALAIPPRDQTSEPWGF